MASEILGVIPIPSSIFHSLIEDIKIEVDSRDSSPARKRQRTESARSSPGVLSEGISLSIRRLTLVLETLERQNPEQHMDLTPTLFNLLDRLMTVESDTRTTFSYPKQIILSCLILMVKELRVCPIL
jgi:U3 small nucleolar RNA-associated protein 10